MNTALIIIDVQKAMDHPKWGERNNFGAEVVMENMLAFARSENWPVFHIQDYSDDPTSPYRACQPLHDFKDEMKSVDGEIVIPKTTGNAFYETDLNDQLKALTISKLVIMGVHTQHCVSATVQAALNNGYDINIMADYGCYSYGQFVSRASSGKNAE